MSAEFGSSCRSRPPLSNGRCPEWNENSSRRSWPKALPGGERNINSTARYTPTPANRTEYNFERASHRPQVKLSRREYSSRTEAGITTL